MTLSISTEEIISIVNDLDNDVEAAKDFISANRNINISTRTIYDRIAKHFKAAHKKAVQGTEPEDNRPLAAGEIVAPDKRRGQLQGTRFVFTSAQNNTYIHEDFFISLMNFCEDRGAQLVVSAFTYNKNGFQNGTKDNDELWYDPRLKDYMVNQSMQVAPELLFCGELDILPTAVNPTSGFETYTQNNSGIIPHAKVQMISLPRMKDDDARFLYTTGAVTLRNYIQRKAGQKAEFHHVFGALYVEIDENGLWFARQLIADSNGVFYDLDSRYSPEGVTSGHRVDGITWGDIHVEKLDLDVANLAWYKNDCMCNVLKPHNQFFHDIIDFSARNHHNIKDPYHLARTYFAGSDSVEEELRKVGRLLDKVYTGSTSYSTLYVIESNHDQALQRWLKEADIKNDPINSVIYHELNADMFKAIRNIEDINIFEHAVKKVNYDLPLGDMDVFFVREDESLLINDIEYGMHGHRGPNGARGNPRGFRSLGHKVNIGHMHTAGIFDGVYVAGVSGNLDMGYNKGPSSWSHSHIVTYANGKRCIITMRKNKWRA